MSQTPGTVAGRQSLKDDGRNTGTLARIAGLIVGYRSARVLFTSVALDIFEQFRSGPRDAAAVAGSLSLDARATGILLDALAGLGFLEKNSGGYRNSEAAERHLLKDSPSSLFHNLRYQGLLWKAWSELDEAVRSGAPRADLLEHLRDPSFTEDYILAMREIAKRPAAEVAAALAPANPRRCLDVGCGPGEFSRALLEACPESRAVLLDLASTLRLARKSLAGHPAHGRMQWLEADYHAADFGKEAFDLVLLSHVTHDEGESDNLALYRKAFAALRSGGTIAIHDFVVHADRTSPLFGALFAVHMLTYTRQGRTYTEAEYSASLREAGFKDVSSRAICAGAENASLLLTGVKP